MCSIAGMIDLNRDVCALDLSKMRQCMKNRGPDQRGEYRAREAALFHNRLCVIDRKNGMQPMSAVRDGRHYILVYNGELYNTGELRDELKRLGYEFAGHSDTEVVLKSYIEWRDRCVDRFNGIFAFAVWEAEARRLFLARDRMGVKPLFYTLTDGALIFASEIKGLLAHPWVCAQADRDSIPLTSSTRSSAAGEAAPSAASVSVMPTPRLLSTMERISASGSRFRSRMCSTVSKNTSR